MKLLSKNKYLDWDKLSTTQKMYIAMDYCDTNYNENLPENHYQLTPGNYTTALQIIDNNPTIIDTPYYKSKADEAKLYEDGKLNSIKRIDFLLVKFYEHIEKDLLERSKFRIIFQKDNKKEIMESNLDYDSLKKEVSEQFKFREYDSISIEYNKKTEFCETYRTLFEKTNNNEIDYVNIDKYNGKLTTEIFKELYNTNKPEEAIDIDEETSEIILDVLTNNNIKLSANNNKIIIEKNNQKIEAEPHELLDIAHSFLFHEKISSYHRHNTKNTEEYYHFDSKLDMINIHRNEYRETKKAEDNKIHRFIVNNPPEINNNEKPFLIINSNKEKNNENKSKIGIQFQDFVNQDKNNNKFSEKISTLKNNLEIFINNVEKTLMNDRKSQKNIINKKITQGLTKEQIETIESNTLKQAQEFKKLNAQNTDSNKKQNDGGRK